MGVFESLLAPIMGLTLGPLAAPLISAGTSLLGGAINAKNERKGIAAQNAYNDPAQIRARAEAAGFNPVSFIGPGVGNQTAAASGAYMGSAIADAGMSVANEISKSRELGRLENLSRENAKLAAKVESLTLRPKVGGVYAQRQSTPTIAAAVGGGNVSGNSVADRLGDPVNLVAGSSGGIAVPGARLDRGSGVYVAGNRIQPAPGWSPSSVVENEYGDIGQAFYGLGKMAADLGYTHQLRAAEFAQKHTVGKPLKAPPGLVDRTSELLPPLPSDHVMPDDKATRLKKAWQRMGWPSGAPTYGWAF